MRQLWNGFPCEVQHRLLYRVAEARITMRCTLGGIKAGSNYLMWPQFRVRGRRSDSSEIRRRSHPSQAQGDCLDIRSGRNGDLSTPHVALHR